MLNLDVSSILAIIAAISTFYFGIRSIRSDKKNRALEKEKITLEWDDLETVAKDLFLRIRKDTKNNYKPDMIFIPDIKDGTICHMIKSQLSIELPIIPIMTGISVWRDTLGVDSGIIGCYEPFYDMVQTSNWFVFIPKGITDYKNKKILIVDDIALTGETCKGLKEWFLGKGFDKDNIKYACITSTKHALESGHPPDYHWKEIDTFDFYFPWGKGR